MPAIEASECEVAIADRPKVGDLVEG